MIMNEAGKSSLITAFFSCRNEPMCPRLR